MAGRTSVDEALARLGGVATWGQLRRVTSWRRIAAALEAGIVVRTAHGRYALPASNVARQAASRLTGVASHTSAAAQWGWALARATELPHVTVSPRRNIPVARRGAVCLHWRELADTEVVDGWVTSRVRTVIDCCLDLPFDEALAVFDSSWRDGLKPREVQRAALRLPVRQRNRVLALARAADPRSANPFESLLRAVCLTVPGLTVTPQLVIKDTGFFARVDLGDEELKIAVEADSFEFHGSRKALDRDCRRYNALVCRGWLVLRFSWEQVMFEPELVRATILAAVALRQASRRVRRGRSTGAKAGFASKSA